jgi:quercetin dioxygenase-like cupin family protein
MPIRIIGFHAARAVAIPDFGSSGASSVPLASGDGPTRAYAIHLAPGGVIGPHPAGWDQLFLVAQGSGWVAGADGVRHAIGPGEGALIPTGEVHSKGSDSGLLAFMLQASRYVVAGEG